MQKKQQNLRAKIFTPVFRVVDTAFGVAALLLMGSYMVRRYVEYKLTGNYRNITPVDPGIRRKNHKDIRRVFDGESY